MRTMRSALLTLVAAFLACACLTSPAFARTAIIDSVDSPSSAFAPPNVTIETGDTVRWEFDQAATTHTVTSTGANWATPLNESRGPNGAPIERTFNTAGHLQLPLHAPHRHDRLDHGRGAEPRPRARLLQDRRLPARLDPAGHRGDPAARRGQRLHGRRDRGRGRSSPTRTWRTFDVVVFLSTTGEVLNDAQQGAFERYIQGGGGYAGIHAASDTEYTWPWYGELVGGYFRNHPPGTPNATSKIADGDEPSTTGLPATLEPRRRVVQLPAPDDPDRQRQHDHGRLQPAGPAREGPRHRRREDLRRAGRQHRSMTTTRSRGARTSTAAVRGTPASATPRPPSPRRTSARTCSAACAPRPTSVATAAKSATCRRPRPTSRRSRSTTTRTPRWRSTSPRTGGRSMSSSTAACSGGTRAAGPPPR